MRTSAVEKSLTESELGGKDVPRAVMQSLVRKCTLPATMLRTESPAKLVAALQSSPLYAMSIEAALVEALEAFRAVRAQAEAQVSLDNDGGVSRAA